MPRRLLLPLFAALLGALALPALVAAHNSLEGSEPQQGAVVTASPSQMVLRFAKDVPLDTLTVSLVDPSGASTALGGVSAGAAGPKEVVVPLPPLGAGAWGVGWSLLSSDGHAITGTVGFTVQSDPASTGAPTTPTIVAPAPAAGPSSDTGDPAWLRWLLRFASYLAISFVIGVMVTEVLVWPGAGELRRLRHATEAALGAVAVLAFLQLLALAADLAGTGLFGGWGRLGDAADTDSGVALVLRIVMAVAAWLLLVRQRPTTQQTHRELSLLLGLGALATWSFSGHARSMRWPWLGVPVDIVHHAAAAAWIGGLAIVGFVAIRRETPDRLAGVMTRFSKLAAVSVALVVVTGAAQTMRLVHHPGDLTGTTHGRLVLAKVAVVAVMLGIAALNRRRVRAISDEVQGADRAALRSAVAIEFVVGLLVIGLTASLVVSPPGASTAEAASIVPAATSSSVPVTSQQPTASSTSTPAPTSVSPTSTSAPTTSTTVDPSTTAATLDLAVLPDVVAGAELGPVPEGTPVRGAGSDEAPVYENGCHVSWGATKPKEGCFYGDTSSDTLVVITGDSEAAHWFGAFDEAGKANGWKIAIVTKAGCPAADVKVYSAADPTNFYLPYPECPVWRQAALDYIRSLQPDLVVFPMLSRRAIVGVPKKVALPNWQQGLGRSIDAVKQSGSAVLVLGDTPKTNGENVAQCVASRQSDVRPCGNTRDKAVDAARAQGLAQAAEQHGATWVDPSNWMCTETFCPAVIGTSVVYRDKLHLTDRFSRTRAPQIAAAIRYALAGPNA